MGAGCCTTVVKSSSGQNKPINQLNDKIKARKLSKRGSDDNINSGCLPSRGDPENQNRNDGYNIKDDVAGSAKRPWRRNSTNLTQKELREMNLTYGVTTRRPQPHQLKFDTTDEEDSDHQRHNDGVQLPFEIGDQKRESLRIKLPKDIVKDAKLGVYFMQEELLDKMGAKYRKTAVKKDRLDKWFKMVSYGLDKDLVKKVIKKGRGQSENIEPIVFSNYAKIGLRNYFATNRGKFISRLAKGPPPQYRWLAWSFTASQLKQKIPGEYNNAVEKGRSDANKDWQNTIHKDLDRTFPEHPFFNLNKHGSAGQHQLQNILQAYSVYKSEVGYCQSMNFMVAFIQLVSGARENEAFWFFYAVLEKSHNLNPFDGLQGFYIEDFPLLIQYQNVFNELFEDYIPDLFLHFQNEGFPESMWLSKWFMSCFLYSFPFGLCIRIWDNLMAHGTQFIFNVSIAILFLLKDKILLLEDLGEINEYFKLLRDDESREEPQLPPYEEIITEAQEIVFPNERLTELFEKYKPKQKLAQPREIQRRTVITVPPKIEQQEEVKQDETPYEPTLPIQVDIGAEIDVPTGKQTPKSAKKKKKKKKRQHDGGTEIILNQVDQLQIEDLESAVHENYTEIHNHGGSSILPQEEQQAQSSGDAHGNQNGGSSFGNDQNANINSEGASMHQRVRIVTYQDTSVKKKKIKNLGDMEFGKVPKPPLSGQGSARVVGRSSDSLCEENQNSDNNYVIDRDSMQFRKVPLKSGLDNLDESKAHTPNQSNLVMDKLPVSNSVQEFQENDFGMSSSRGNEINPPGHMSESQFSSKSYQQTHKMQGLEKKNIMIGNLLQKTGGAEHQTMKYYQNNNRLGSSSFQKLPSAPNQSQVFIPRVLNQPGPMIIPGNGASLRRNSSGQHVQRTITGGQMIRRQIDDIINEDLNDDEFDYNNDQSEVDQIIQDNSPESEKKIDEENFSVGLGVGINQGIRGGPQNQRRVIGRGQQQNRMPAQQQQVVEETANAPVDLQISQSDSSKTLSAGMVSAGAVAAAIKAPGNQNADAQRQVSRDICMPSVLDEAESLAGDREAQSIYLRHKAPNQNDPQRGNATSRLSSHRGGHGESIHTEMQSESINIPSDKFSSQQINVLQGSVSASNSQFQMFKADTAANSFGGRHQQRSRVGATTHENL